jgi:hypothetical protein
MCCRLFLILNKHKVYCLNQQLELVSRDNITHLIIIKNEVTGGWRKLYNEEFCNLCSLPHIIRMMTSRTMRWAGHVARIGRRRMHVVGKPEGKRPLGKPRRRWADNIKIDLREIGWDGMDWIDLARDRDHWKALVNTVMHFRIPYNAVKFLSTYIIGGFSISSLNE